MVYFGLRKNVGFEMILILAVVWMVKGQAKVYLMELGSGGEWNGLCDLTTCFSPSSPCSLPISGSSITLSGLDDCELVFMNYANLPSLSLILTGSKRINLTTDENGLSDSGSPWSFPSNEGVSFNDSSSFTFSGSDSIIRLKHYRGYHNQSMIFNVKEVHFENVWIGDIKDTSSSWLNYDMTFEEEPSFIHLPSTPLFRFNSPLTFFSAIDVSIAIHNFAQAFQFFAFGTVDVEIENFKMKSAYPHGAYTVAAFFSSTALESIWMKNYETYRVMPYGGWMKKGYFENGICNEVPGTLQVPSTTVVSDFTLLNVSMTMAGESMMGYLLEDVREVLMEKVKSESFFTGGSFATLKGVEKVMMKDVDLKGWILMDSRMVVSGNVEISLKNSNLSMAHQLGGVPLIVQGPSDMSKGMVMTMEDVNLERAWNGYEMSFENHIIFPNEMTFDRLTLRSGSSVGKISAPRLEVKEEMRGGSFAGEMPSIEFNCSVSVHATQFLNLIPSFRDDELFYFPADRFGRGIQAFPPFAVSSIWISWNLPPPAVFSSHAVSYGILNISLFSTLPGDDRYNISAQYSDFDPERSFMTFLPLPCPSPCANSFASFNSPFQHQSIDSLCSSSLSCFSELFEATILDNIYWDFSSLTILPNGSISFLGNSSHFQQSLTISDNAISNFIGDSNFNSPLISLNNISLSIHGHTSSNSDISSLSNSSLSFFGDFQCNHLQIGPGSSFIAGFPLNSIDLSSSHASLLSSQYPKRSSLNSFNVAGNLNFSSVLASISSPSASIQRDFGLYGETDLTIDGDAHFIIGGNLEFSENSKISIQPHLNGFSSSNKRNELWKRGESTAYFDADGEAKVGGTIQVNLTDSDLQSLNGTSGKLLLVKGSTISGNIELLVETNQGGCASVTGVGETQIEDSVPSGSQILSVFIFTNTDGCSNPSQPMTPSQIEEEKKKATKTWPIILGSVLGGIALIIFISIILIIKIPTLRATVVPYSTTV